MTADCVDSRGNGGWATSIEVIPGMDGASRPYGSVVGRSFRSVNGWINSADPNDHYGCIIAPTPIGNNTVGYFGFAKDRRVSRSPGGVGAARPPVLRRQCAAMGR